MITFSIICLIFLLLALTHLINWMWRLNNSDPETVGMKLFATVLYGVALYFLLKYIIIWGSQLSYIIS